MLCVGEKKQYEHLQKTKDTYLLLSPKSETATSKLHSMDKSCRIMCMLLVL